MEIVTEGTTEMTVAPAAGKTIEVSAGQAAGAAGVLMAVGLAAGYMFGYCKGKLRGKAEAEGTVKSEASKLEEAMNALKNAMPGSKKEKEVKGGVVDKKPTDEAPKTE